MPTDSQVKRQRNFILKDRFKPIPVKTNEQKPLGRGMGCAEQSVLRSKCVFLHTTDKPSSGLLYPLINRYYGNSSY